MSPPSNTVETKFDWRNIRPVYEGRFSVTARYDWDKDVEPGDHLVLTDPEGEPFALARVDMLAHMTVRTFYEMDFHDHRSYTSIGQFIDELRGYYPESADEIGRITPLTVIRFDVFDLLRDYPLDQVDERVEEAADAS